VQSLRPSLIQEQRQKLSPQLVLGMQIMALPLLDLETRITAEVEQNPALEIVKEQQHETISANSNAEQDWDENAYSSYEYNNYDFEASDLHHEFVQGQLSRPETLQEHLLWQLRLNPMPEDFFQIGETLIRNIDHHGFHRLPPSELFTEDRWPALTKVLEIIQAFDPLGCCTDNCQNSLLVQARQYADMPALVPKLLSEHFDLLDRLKPKELAKTIKVSEDLVLESIEFIRHLSPNPGQGYGNDETNYVVPDVLITKHADDIVIFINDEQIPVLGINPFFDEMLKRKDNEKATASYVNTKLRDARWFINSVRMRNETLMKVVRTLVEFQKEFFLHGPKKIGILPRK
jgi:RNA polymerase sigma-54 factor